MNSSCSRVWAFLKSSPITPSIREIGDAVGLRSTSTVHSHLRTLQREGKITMIARRPRSVVLLLNEGEAEQMPREKLLQIELAKSQNKCILLEDALNDLVTALDRGDKIAIIKASWAARGLL